MCRKAGRQAGSREGKEIKSTQSTKRQPLTAQQQQQPMMMITTDRPQQQQQHQQYHAKVHIKNMILVVFWCCCCCCSLDDCHRDTLRFRRRRTYSSFTLCSIQRDAMRNVQLYRVILSVTWMVLAGQCRYAEGE